MPGECGREFRALLRCGLRQFCIEDIDPEDPNSIGLIAAACPNQAIAFAECQNDL